MSYSNKLYQLLLTVKDDQGVLETLCLFGQRTEEVQGDTCKRVRYREWNNLIRYQFSHNPVPRTLLEIYLCGCDIRGHRGPVVRVANIIEHSGSARLALNACMM